MDYYLIRHAESTLNREHTLQGWYNAPLSTQGMRQAAALQGVLPSCVIVTSDLSRALDTAHALALPTQKVQPDARLREADVGEWSGIPKVLVQESTLWKPYQRAPHEFRFPGGESLREVQRRMIGAFEEYLQAYSQLIIVSHHLALKTLICYLQNRSLADLHQFSLPNASITRVTQVGSHFICEGVGFSL
ncbi:hypothetical protein BXT84_07545 [Sulfobacillus thermotolerans]|uniref:Histidine phosphatase family protein n=1 Tax=Sulfobacillus thermotolerans TaxID=338644 RepID=A0ABM6RR59_9FIRM|nr:hypothetical protein BXT84_07545 [Sulfobacillus thermotolerans]